MPWTGGLLLYGDQPRATDGVESHLTHARGGGEQSAGRRGRAYISSILAAGTDVA